ncbi:MAG TPA: response regulator [Rhodocyclaceae bacterium]|nr:response regulator [Rhodocyclaceae bacterium]
MSELSCYILEDSAVIRENLIATLEEMSPVRVIGSAEDQKTALHWLQNSENHCDVLIADIFLKSGSGLEVLKAVQNLQSVGKRVVLTNYATVDIRRRCLELGADKVFDKSGEIEGLINYCTELANENGSH